MAMQNAIDAHDSASGSIDAVLATTGHDDVGAAAAVNDAPRADCADASPAALAASCGVARAIVATSKTEITIGRRLIAERTTIAHADPVASDMDPVPSD